MEHPPVAGRPLRLEKWWFFVVFLVGAGAIIALDSLSLPKGWSASVSAGLLIVYAAAATLVPRVRARPDQVADNSYYLGLLFTLISLAIALYKFANTEMATESILRNFGVAIFSTIAGLALRVLLGQFREDPEDQEYEARAALSETVRRLRADLDRSIAEVQQFADGTRQAMHQVATTAGQSTVEALDKAVTRFENATNAMSARFEATATSFEERSAAFDGSLGRMSGAVDGLATRIGTVQVDDQMIAGAIKPAVTRLDEAVSGLAKNVDSERERLTSSLALLGGFTTALKAFDGSAEALSASATKLEASVLSLEGASSSFAGLEQAANATARAATGFATRLDVAGADELKRGAEAVEAIRRAAEALVQQASGSLNAVDGAASRVKATLEGLNAEFSTSGETVDNVRRELADLADWITRRLERQ